MWVEAAIEGIYAIERLRAEVVRRIVRIFTVWVYRWDVPPAVRSLVNGEWVDEPVVGEWRCIGREWRWRAHLQTEPSGNTAAMVRK